VAEVPIEGRPDAGTSGSMTTSAALALRQMSMVHNELPKYLLAPGVSALLHYVPDLRRKMRLVTLWNTGARINEALALTRGDFSLTPPYPFVQLAPLKQRTEKAARTAGRMPAGQQTPRMVPLSDSWYVSQLQTMVATLKIPMERRNKRTGRTEKARIWEVTFRVSLSGDVARHQFYIQSVWLPGLFVTSCPLIINMRGRLTRPGICFFVGMR